jgi:hypothetical protein
MAQAAVIAVAELLRLLQAEAGLPLAAATLSRTGDELPPVSTTDIVNGQIGSDLLEKSAVSKYPSFFVYCERVTNKLVEKFRTFSGSAELVIEVRVSHEHTDEVSRQLNAYVQAVTDVLDDNRGIWMRGVFYAGAYEITFQPVKRGGKNFIQSARVRVETHVSVD